ncbi:MAG TPA: SsrA-binding protein SmpB [bacterium]|nr:SsrA-binding protein SmpB [bacterium]
MSERAPTLQNRKAHHDYFILESQEAGIALAGCEVKSIRNGKASLQDSFARVEKDEVWLYGMHISPYEQGNRYNLEPTRVRKLLLKRSEIQNLAHRVQEKGLSMVPIRLYFKHGKVKIQLAIARGKSVRDKRDKLREKEANRDIDRALRARQKRL